MKSFVALALLSCLCPFLPTSEAQTQAKKNQPLPYTDADGLILHHRLKNREIEERAQSLCGRPTSGHKRSPLSQLVR
jgi:hypothetical protein